MLVDQTPGWEELDWSPADGIDGGAVSDIDVPHDTHSPAGLLAMLLAGPPGPESIGLLHTLGAMALSEEERIVTAQAWERQASWLEAQRVRAVAALTGPDPEDTDALDPGPMLVAVALNLSARGAQSRADTARALTGPFTATLHALEAGLLTWAHTRVLLELLEPRDPQIAARVEQVVLARAARRLPMLTSWRQSIRRELLRRDAAGEVAAQRERLAADQGVKTWQTEDGAAVIQATMPAVEAHFVMTALRAHAHALREADKAALRQAKAEGTAAGGDRVQSLQVYLTRALTLWARRAIDDRDLTTPRRIPVHLGVVIDLPTLLGLADNPAEVHGLGPIDPALARILAAMAAEDAGWRRWVTDPVTGHLLDYGKTTYAPPKALTDYILARDPVCGFPGCTIPSRICEIDHLDPYPRPGAPPEDGGDTSADNTTPLHKAHHQLKTDGEWSTERRPDGGLRWTHRSGWHIDIPPPRVLPE